MLAVFVTASTITTAGDTLRIESLRTANLCSDDATFLLTGSIGEVFFSDSLMYFDITLRYDTSVLRPTQGFPQGTLAGQLDFGAYNPAYDFRTRGEIGISAYSISTPAKGNIPLFAIGGDFIGDCSDSDSITVPYPIDLIHFNEEYKRTVTLYVSEIFEAVSIPRDRPDLGASFNTDSVTIESPDTTVQVQAELTTSSLERTPIILTLTKSPTNGITIDSLVLAGLVPDSVIRYGADTVKAYFTAPDNSPLRADIALSTSHAITDDSTTLRLVLEANEKCGCIRPTKTDSMKVRTHKTPVSALSDVDEDPVTIQLMEDAIEVQGVHGQPGFLTVYGLDGAIVHRTMFNEGSNTTRIPIHDLSHGAYYVTATCGGLTLTKKLLK